MATVRPFRAIRPTKEKAPYVAALPYDVMDTQEARQMVEGNPDSFLHVDRAEIDLPENTNPYSDIVYEKAKQNLQNMIQTGILFQEKSPSFYLYRLEMDGRGQLGFVSCTAIDEYLDGTIKKHELTREEKELDRIRHVDICNANTGPIFLAYRGKKEIKDMLSMWIQEHRAEYDFKSEDGIRHTVWVMQDNDVIEKLIELFQSVPNFYIADGHHRNASAVKVGQARRLQKGICTGQEEFNFYLSVVFDADELKILDYNRVVKDIYGLSKEEFLKKLENSFLVEPYYQDSFCKPPYIHTFGMYLEGQWYLLTAKKEIISDNPVDSLDVSILQKEILCPIFGIQDPRTDDRVDFIGGIRGLEYLKRYVDSGEGKVAFSMFPTSMQELMNIADNGLIMPPKSTWFEPKLRSGLFIHSLEEK